MRLLLFTKRHLTAKDIIVEQFGRYYELAAGLSTLGWDVKCYCLDYRSHLSREVTVSGGVTWYSYSVLAFAAHWHTTVKRDIRRWKPDVVLACSDSIHIAAGLTASRLTEAPLALDLHDNLESFRLMSVPGMRRSLRKATQVAELVSFVSEPLQRKVAKDYVPRGELLVLENAVPKAFEKPFRNKILNRERYGFGEGDCVIGVAGALYRKRGIETILAGYEILRRDNSNVVLALAGPTDDICREFSRHGVRYCGNLAYSSIVSFLDTFDVGIVPNIRPAFADYCYPQKAVEMCSMSVPIVAADLGVMRSVAVNHPQILYQPRDPIDLARAVRYQCENRVVVDLAVNTWAQQSEKLNRSLLKLVK